MAFKEKDKWIKDVDAQDWLNNSELGYSIWNNKYRFREDETFDKWVDRVSGGNKEYGQLIRERKALLGGRTLSNRGTGNKASMSNCYCSGYAPDSVDGMLDLAKKLALTYQAQGGQGLSMSKVRPKGAPIRGGQFESDGIIPFMEIFNTVTASISQGGCIAKDELVLTENGYKRIEDVKIGDKVWTKVGFIEVNHVFDKGIQDIYEVITKHGNRIKTTIDHKFAINPNDKIPLKELKVNDMIVGIVPSNQDEIEDLPSQNNVWFDGFEKVLYKDYIVSIELVGQDHVYDLSLVKEHLFSCNGIYVSNSRKGALMISLSAFHPEILSFVTIKSDINKINKANLSVEIDDEFMEAVRTYFKTGEKIVVHRKETYDSGDYEYDVTPIDIYLAICKEAHANAEPGIIYTNRFRNYNIMEKDDDYQIITSNPCFTGDTLVLTDKGYFEIQNLVGQKVNVWNGYEYSEVEPRVTGKNQELMKITFSNGMSVKCTPYHKFILAHCPRTEAKDLKHGMKLADFDYPVLGETEDVERNLKYFRSIMENYGSVEEGNLVIKSDSAEELQLAITALNIKSTVMDNYLIVTKNELAKLNKYWHITDTVYNSEEKFDIYIDKVEKLDYKADKVYCFTEYKNHSGIFNGILAAQCGRVLASL